VLILLLVDLSVPSEREAVAAAFGAARSTVQPTTAPAAATEQPANQVQPVTMKDNKFDPADLTIKVGTTVRWINRENAGGPSYTVTSVLPDGSPGPFDSGETQIAPGKRFNYKFTTPGIYEYFSRTNPEMRGRITVTQ
jgi:plastocyanin